MGPENDEKGLAKTEGSLINRKSNIIDVIAKVLSFEARKKFEKEEKEIAVKSTRRIEDKTNMVEENQ